MSTAATPTVKGSIYTFAFGETVFAVDAAKGGRIATFSLAGRSILTVAKNAEDNNWGSTFWPSPQSDWGWPPPAEIDPQPHQASIVGDRLLLASQAAPALELAVTKEFSVDPAKAVVTVWYRLVNKGSKARKVAPWEITRVAAGGLTFFPMGEGAPNKGPQDLLPLQVLGGVAWLDYGTVAGTSDQKVFADGSEGWIAHAAGDLLLVKAFTDIGAAEAAPGEAEIEIYTDAGRTYIEVENQGAYASIAPGAAMVWNVRWFLRRLDASLSARKGSTDLPGFVRMLVGS